MNLELISLIVDDYDEAIAFFVNVLQFTLAKDEPSLTNDGRPKRWVVVQPPNCETGLLLAKANGERQAAAVGDQFAGRVGLFLRENCRISGSCWKSLGPTGTVAITSRGTR